MDFDPMAGVNDDDDELEDAANNRQAEELIKEKHKSRLNTWVAVTVAILATFLGICKVKDDNIVQAMQQAQAKSVDSWNWYQAKKIRADVARTAQDQFEIQLMTAPTAVRPLVTRKIESYKKQAAKQIAEVVDVEKQAKGAEKEYDRLNFHDDQFDLSDALLAIAISLLAVTSLTQKRWLFGIAMVPTVFGVLFGLAGLFNLPIHSDFFAKILGT
jgi:hypothetical protein